MSKDKTYFQTTETKGLCQGGLLKAYADRQASDNPYDKNSELIGYIGPEYCARYLSGVIPEFNRSKLRVLDVGAGTGLVAQQLRKCGFTDIDALEPSEALLMDAKQKKLYQAYHQIFLTGEHCGIASDSYDAIICCGCLIENHLQKESFNEMIRLVKPGGHIVIANRTSSLHTVESHKDNLEPYMARLEAQGKWRQARLDAGEKWKHVKKETFPNFFLNYEGTLWHYCVL